ncbi:MAG: type III pantothenate kinase [Burkholderiales bacterium]|nr:type III pantothenate kinase [Burkholderiales bacterium]
MDTILVLDAGNTRLKWGIAERHGWTSFGSVSNDRIGALRITQWKKLPRPNRVVGANVSGEAGRSRIETQIAHWHIKAEWLSVTQEACGVKNNYHVPRALGVDRWAALIAIRQRQLAQTDAPLPYLIVTSGTTITVNALTADGVFLGGAILPGVSSMRYVLSTNTSALTLNLPVGSYHEYPLSTEDAIYSGSVDAIVGMIRAWRERLAVSHELSAHEIPVVITGGDSDFLMPYLPEPKQIIAHLVLEGVLKLALPEWANTAQNFSES